MSAPGSASPVSYTQKNVDTTLLPSSNITRFADVLVSRHNRLNPILPLSFYRDQHLTAKTQASFDLSFYDTNDPALLKVLLFDRMFLKPLSDIVVNLAIDYTFSVSDDFILYSLVCLGASFVLARWMRICVIVLFHFVVLMLAPLFSSNPAVSFFFPLQVMLMVLISSQVFFALFVVAPLINKLNKQLFRTNSMLFAVPIDVLIGVEGVGAILELEFDQPVDS